MRKKVLISLMLVIAMASCGCQKKPESSIVVNKDMDKLIDKAKETDASGENNPLEMQEKYDHYTYEGNDTELNVSLKVDAQVDIPKTDKMSVMRVKQSKISQEMLDKVINTFVGDKEIYDGKALAIRTRDELAKEISDTNKEYDEIENDPQYSEDSKEGYRADRQMIIDRLQKEYENAPTEVNLKEFVSDKKLTSIDEKIKDSKLGFYYSRDKELNKDGDVYHGVTDEVEGIRELIYAQNNSSYSNCIRYYKIPLLDKEDTDMLNFCSVGVGCTNLKEGSPSVWPANEEIPQNVIDTVGSMDDNQIIPECMNNSDLKTTMEEATNKANEAVKTIVGNDFVLDEFGYFNERISFYKYRKVYIFKYARQIDGANVSTEGEKYAEGGEAFSKQIWPSELVEVKIDDSGIVEFTYNAPLEIVETVVDKSSMKSFDEVKGIFEKMAPIVNASEYYAYDIDVETVKLKYERISEKDSFDTGLLIPVWNFYGKKTDTLYNETDEVTVLTINAIDGSVVNRELGY